MDQAQDTGATAGHFPFSAKPEGWVDAAISKISEEEFSAMSDDDKTYLTDLVKRRSSGDKALKGTDLDRVKKIDATLNAKRA